MYMHVSSITASVAQYMRLSLRSPGTNPPPPKKKKNNNNQHTHIHLGFFFVVWYSFAEVLINDL